MSIFPQQVLNGTRSKEEISLQLNGSPLIAVHPAQIYSEPLFPDVFVSSHFQPSQTREHSYSRKGNLIYLFLLI